ncbi:MAG: hypothetical protein IIU74_03740, partial [Ruminiclostridium sp.]|nr:hypothetical protein [Ruminiclostridium sp.]
MENHWTFLAFGLIIYNVLVSLQTDHKYLGNKRIWQGKNRGDAMKQMFYGGVHPAEHKEATEHKPIQQLAKAPA